MKNYASALLIGLFFSLFFIPITIAQTSLQESPLIGYPLTGGDQPESFFDFIRQDAVPQLELKTDLKSLLVNKKKDEYQKAVISFTTMDGEQFEREAKIKARGKSRRKICDFPPIKIKFAKDDLQLSGLHTSYNKLKLVTHCFSSNASEEKLMKEYLVYKMYNLLSEYSYDVQLLKLKYIDTERKFKSVSKHAFLIEGTEELADRLSAEELEVYNTQPVQMAPQHYLTLALFQYMIANTDWRIDIMHNLKLMRVKGVEGLVAIPYDFDFSGLVNAHYAIPNPDLNLFDVRDRYFQGVCPTEGEMQEVVNLFLSNKVDLLALCDQFDDLHKKERQDARFFVESFYSELEDTSKCASIFTKVCQPATEAVPAE